MGRVNPYSGPYSIRILIAFITAHHPSCVPHIAAQRERMKNSPLPYKFIYGDSSTQTEPCPSRQPLEDELFFPVNDRKEYMVLKDKALFEWALNNGYDFVFRACQDSIVYPQRILDNLDMLRQHDYAGTMCGYAHLANFDDPFALRYLDYMHGGVGIWLSRRAMEMLISDDWKGPYSSPYTNQVEIVPGHWQKGAWNIYWDDLWIGEVLKGNLNYNDPRRNDVYDNYLVNVWDNPELFASNTPFDETKVIATHSLEQMGESNLKPKPFSTRFDKIQRLIADWASAQTFFKTIEPK